MIEPEPEFQLPDGSFVPLSRVPRDLLEQWCLQLSARSQEMHRRVRIMKAMLEVVGDKPAQAEAFPDRTRTFNLSMANSKQSRCDRSLIQASTMFLPSVDSQVDGCSRFRGRIW
jgi:hypothetical protein